MEEIDIKATSEKFIMEDDLCTQLRYSILTAVGTMKDLYDSKLTVYRELSEADADALKQYAEYVSIRDVLSHIHDDIIRLDNKRCECLQILGGILNESNFSKELPKEIKEYN